MMAWLRSQRWWAMRVFALPVHLLAFAVVAFFLVAAMPGDPVEALTGGQVTPANYAAIKHSLGLDQNLTSGRRNGLGAMVERLRAFAARFAEPKEQT